MGLLRCLVNRGIMTMLMHITPSLNVTGRPCATSLCRMRWEAER